ncbi:MAG: hypothetical protein GY729_16170 [Desulfobacteraceae bacterium]|nr:hypothetical protein [Desulfobacteraceae bacterium]
MIQILLASSNATQISQLLLTYKPCDIDITGVTTGKEVIQILDSRTFDFLIVDEAFEDFFAKELIEEILRINPMINMAVLSSLDDKAFHEFYEGLGLIGRIPCFPGKKDIKSLFIKLLHILEITTDMPKIKTKEYKR